MNYTLLSFWANIFGFVAGGISLLGFIVAMCQPHLPSKKIKILEALLLETENTFKEAVEAGLLVPEFAAKTENSLIGLKEQTCTLRARAYNVTSLGRDCTELLRGTSSAIELACQSIKKIRAEVITSSEERRRRLIQMGSQQTQSVPALPTNPTAQYHHIPASILIPRPSSCPPVLSTEKSNNTRNVPLENSGSLDRIGINSGSHPIGSSSSSLCNSSRSDSNVQRVGVQF